MQKLETFRAHESHEAEFFLSFFAFVYFLLVFIVFIRLFDSLRSVDRLFGRTMFACPFGFDKLDARYVCCVSFVTLFFPPSSIRVDFGILFSSSVFSLLIMVVVTHELFNGTISVAFGSIY